MSTPALSPFELGWLVGLIEGDGTFTFDGVNVVVVLKITDLDTAQRFAGLMRTTVSGPYHYEGQQLGSKPYYMTKIAGKRAREFMSSTHQYFSQRRQEQIAELLGDQLAIDLPPIPQLVDLDQEPLIVDVVQREIAGLVA
ncbi:MAG TPA: hypothetical protein VGD45_20480 [Steroidobacter sp.]|uniref:hypothetical protein n=1 Tax=Steroidobacter sp. TaxID=1978227 RepID=UPI002EDB2874